MRTPLFNIRFFFVTVLVILAVVGGVVGWLWYAGQPKVLLDGARAAFEQAEQARKKDDKPRAITNYRTAEDKLAMLLAEGKDPRNFGAWQLRAKTNMWLGRFLKAEDAAKGDKLEDNGYRYAKYAAENDPNQAEAQAMMVEQCFAFDAVGDPTALKRCERFARDLVANVDKEKDPNARPDVDNWETYVASAHYVLAREALRGGRPDETLRHVEKAVEWEKKDAVRKPETAKSVPRWRTVEQEALALKAKADAIAREKKPGAKTNEPFDQLATLKMPAWLERARRELQEKIPGDAERPERSAVANFNVANLRGLLTVLQVGVEIAPDKSTVQERVDLILQVCETVLKSKDIKPYVQREAAKYAALVPHTLANLPTAKLPDARVVDGLQQRALDLNDLISGRGDNAAIDPATFLLMSLNSHKEGKLDRALDLARKGLDLAKKQNYPPESDLMMQLHREIAWILLIQKKPVEAEVHLAQMARVQERKPDVQYLQGLAAVLDGRLDDGAKKLQPLAKTKGYTRNLPLLMALSHCYMGQSKYDMAAPVLDTILEIYDANAKAPHPDTEPFVRHFLPTPAAVVYDQFRARLGLAMRGDYDERTRQSQFVRAEQHRAQLRNTVVAPAADALLINSLVVQARTAAPEQAEAFLEKAEAVFAATPEATRDDTRLVWAKVNLVLARPRVDAAALGTALIDTVGVGTDAAARLAANTRARGGAAAQWQEADRIVSTLATQKDAQAQYNWVHWLRSRGRVEEAIAYLNQMELDAPTDEARQRVRLVRAGVAAVAAPRDERTREMMEQLGRNPTDLPAEAAAMLAAFQAGGNMKDLNEKLNELGARHQQSGVIHYWQGQVRQVNGQFLEAIQSYERSLQFNDLKAASQAGLLGSIMALAQSPKFGPEAAYKEAIRLKSAHGDDAAVLLAHANLARIMDDVEGMRASLADLPRVLHTSEARTKEAAAVAAANIAATQWTLAARPDLARRELQTALQNDPKHLPTLATAYQLAVGDEDWAAAADLLRRIAEVQPTNPDLPLWRAALQYNTNQKEIAKETLADYIKANPDKGAGYLLLANVYERDKDYKTALETLRRWRAKHPDDLNGFQGEVRLLTLQGQGSEAAQSAEAFLNAELDKAGKGFDEASAKVPPKDDKEKTERAKNRALYLAGARLNGVLRVGAALQDAGEFALAEQWLARAEKLVKEDLPEETRKANDLAMRLLRGSLYLNHAGKLKDGPQRTAVIDKAIAEYQAVWDASKGHRVAGNNLAWLLLKEKNEPQRALEIMEKVRAGVYSQKPLSGDRLHIELLDTLGVIYRAASKSEDAVKLFQDAIQRYGQEPRVLTHLGQSLKGMGKQQDLKAYEYFNLAIQFGEAKLKTTVDQEKQEKLKEVIATARKEQRAIGLVGAPQNR